METMWASHPDFPSIIENVWHNSPSLINTIEEFKTKTQNWNKNTFGNIINKKKFIILRLEGIHRSSNYPYSHFLLQLEHELISEFNLTLKHEEEFWRLKSRIDWLQENDASTKYFQVKTLNHHRRNNIHSFQKEDDS